MWKSSTPTSTMAFHSPWAQRAYILYFSCSRAVDFSQLLFSSVYIAVCWATNTILLALPAILEGAIFRNNMPICVGFSMPKKIEAETIFTELD
jgi:hypothetical protein